MINDIIYIKILKALELICPLYQNNLISEAFIVGSVAKGTATKDSDIDIYLVNPQFQSYDIELKENTKELLIQKIVDLLKNLGVDFDVSYYQEEKDSFYDFEYQLYKNEVVHIMYDYESESIKKAGEYIEITKDFCDIIKIR